MIYIFFYISIFKIDQVGVFMFFWVIVLLESNYPIWFWKI